MHYTRWQGCQTRACHGAFQGKVTYLPIIKPFHVIYLDFLISKLNGIKNQIKKSQINPLFDNDALISLKRRENPIKKRVSKVPFRSLAHFVGTSNKRHGRQNNGIAAIKKTKSMCSAHSSLGRSFLCHPSSTSIVWKRSLTLHWAASPPER